MSIATDPSQKPSRKPLWSINVGGIQATCFENDRITFQKRYLDKTRAEFVSTNNLFTKDIPVAIEVLRIAFQRLATNGDDHREEDKGQF